VNSLRPPVVSGGHDAFPINKSLSDSDRCKSHSRYIKGLRKTINNSRPAPVDYFVIHFSQQGPSPEKAIQDSMLLQKVLMIGDIYFSRMETDERNDGHSMISFVTIENGNPKCLVIAF
jgi:hypothetical protein